MNAQQTTTMKAPHVFLTNRKPWLASGGFEGENRIQSGKRSGLDFAKDFRKGCPKAVIADKKDSADYAVAIDEIGFADSVTKPDSPTFTVAVYKRGGGLLYSGGTSFLKNAVKDACDAIGAK